MILIYFENGLFLLGVTPKFVKSSGTKSNKSFDEVWCLQHNKTNEIKANELVFILGKTGLDNPKRKLSDLILMVDSGGTATIKNNLNTPLPPQS